MADYYGGGYGNQVAPDGDEYDRWAQEVNNAVLRQSLPFPYIMIHKDELGYRDGSDGFFSGGSRSSGYSSGTSHHSSSVGYSNNATRGRSNTPHGLSSGSGSRSRNTSHSNYGSRANQYDDYDWGYAQGVHDELCRESLPYLYLQAKADELDYRGTSTKNYSSREFGSESRSRNISHSDYGSRANQTANDPSK